MPTASGRRASGFAVAAVLRTNPNGLPFACLTHFDLQILFFIVLFLFFRILLNEWDLLISILVLFLLFQVMVLPKKYLLFLLFCSPKKCTQYNYLASIDLLFLLNLMLLQRYFFHSLCHLSLHLIPNDDIYTLQF